MEVLMRKTAFITTGLLILTLIACEDNSTGPENVLVLSDSFERSGSPTTTGWQIVTDLYDFDIDTPEDGGYYSLMLLPGNDIEGTAVKTIEVEHGDGIYTFSVWGKMSTDQPENTAYIKFGVLSNEIPTQLTTFELSDTTWTQFTVTDTLAFETDDLIYIKLSCGAGQTGDQWYSLFDAVRLEKLNE